LDTATQRQIKNAASNHAHGFYLLVNNMKTLTICFLVIACFECSKTNNKTNLDKSISITSDELVDAIDNNVVGAKLKFQGKPITCNR
jgi:hypothetical protein